MPINHPKRMRMQMVVYAPVFVLLFFVWLLCTSIDIAMFVLFDWQPMLTEKFENVMDKKHKS